MRGFFDLKPEKISEKAFVRGLIVSVIGIFICIVALCSATYAWFVGDVSSESNTITSGSFNVTVSVVGSDEGAVTELIPHSTRDGGWEFALSAGTYTVILKPTEQSTVKGHCIVTVGNDPAWHTAPILSEAIANAAGLTASDPFVFTLAVEEETTLTVLPCWGLAVETHIGNGDDVDLTTPPEETETDEEFTAESEDGSDETIEVIPEETTDETTEESVAETDEPSEETTDDAVAETEEASEETSAEA